MKKKRLNRYQRFKKVIYMTKRDVDLLNKSQNIGGEYCEVIFPKYKYTYTYGFVTYWFAEFGKNK